VLYLLKISNFNQLANYVTTLNNWLNDFQQTVNAAADTLSCRPIRYVCTYNFLETAKHSK